MITGNAVNQPPLSRTGQRGFNLTELLIVVAIIGILAAVGIPQYKQYALRAKRADARAALTQMSAVQERYYSNVSPPSYATTVTALGYTNPAYSTDGYWTLTLTGLGSPSTVVTIVATAGGTEVHADEDCTTLTLTTQGVRSYSGNAANAEVCWGD